MTRILTSTALVAAMGVAAVPAAAEFPLGDVVVETRDASIGGNAEGTFFPNMEKDLENAIEARLPTTGLDTDALIEVKIIEVYLDGDTAIPDSQEFNQMRITANYSHPENKFVSEIYPAFLNAEEMDFVAPEGFQVVDPEAPDFYRALIAGAADEVVRLMPEKIVVTAVN
ncbi:MAG: hypothetical protein AAFQ19_08835 [Pseudomonadota bacterium]